MWRVPISVGLWILRGPNWIGLRSLGLGLTWSKSPKQISFFFISSPARFSFSQWLTIQPSMPSQHHLVFFFFTSRFLLFLHSTEGRERGDGRRWTRKGRRCCWVASGSTVACWKQRQEARAWELQRRFRIRSGFFMVTGSAREQAAAAWVLDGDDGAGGSFWTGEDGESSARLESRSVNSSGVKFEAAWLLGLATAWEGWLGTTMKTRLLNGVNGARRRQRKSARSETAEVATGRGHGDVAEQLGTFDRWVRRRHRGRTGESSGGGSSSNG